MAVVTLAFEVQRPIVVLGLYSVASAIACLLYALDKAAAQRGSRRVAENTLHLWSLLGGWPGAFVAQRVFRHKTRKVSFQIIFWITVVLNCVALVWALSPSGIQVLQRPLETAGAGSDMPRVTPGPRSGTRPD